jgi:hypothetical protein
LRPGYTLNGLRELLKPSFSIEQALTYSKTFSELLDTVLNGAYLKMQKQRGPATQKGTVVTQQDLRKHKKQFALLSALYPLLWAVAKLDLLLWFRPGYKLMVKATRRGDD